MGDKINNIIDKGLPVSFGKQAQSVDIESRLAIAQRPEFLAFRDALAQNSNSESDFSDTDEEDETAFLPISHQLILSSHSKAISSLSVSSNGSRFVSGSRDNLVKFWDFNGLDYSSPSPFRSIEPIESHQIRKCLFSPSGSHVLVLGRSSKPVLYSNDGSNRTEFVSGDMYLVDMKNTKGHIAEITTGSWNPLDRQCFATGSADSTIRIWDSQNTKTQKSVIIVRSSEQTAKTKVDSLCWTNDGHFICAASSDGEIKAWDSRGSLLRPSYSLVKAHEKGTITSGICTSGLDNYTLATRGGDSTVKVWDLRRFNSPLLSTPSNLENISDDTNIMFSPDNKYIITGSSEPSTNSGFLNILDKSDLSQVATSALKFDSSVTQVNWHKGLNQILVGLANGKIYLLFNPDLSNKGALLPLNKQVRRRHIDDNSELTTNISVQGLAEGDDYMAKHFEEQKRAKQESKRNRPQNIDPGVWGVPTEDHLRDAVENSSFGKEDPRDELLKYAERAATDPMFKHTRVKKIYAEVEDNEEEVEANIKRQKL